MDEKGRAHRQRRGRAARPGPGPGGRFPNFSAASNEENHAGDVVGCWMPSRPGVPCKPWGAIVLDPVAGGLVPGRRCGPDGVQALLATPTPGEPVAGAWSAVVLSPAHGNGQEASDA